MKYAFVLVMLNINNNLFYFLINYEQVRQALAILKISLFNFTFLVYSTTRPTHIKLHSWRRSGSVFVVQDICLIQSDPKVPGKFVEVLWWARTEN